MSFDLANFYHIILVFEFTYVEQDFPVPIMAATAGSMAMRELLVLHDRATAVRRSAFASFVTT